MIENLSKLIEDAKSVMIQQQSIVNELLPQIKDKKLKLFFEDSLIKAQKGELSIETFLKQYENASRNRSIRKKVL